VRHRHGQHPRCHSVPANAGKRGFLAIAASGLTDRLKPLAPNGGGSTWCKEWYPTPARRANEGNAGFPRWPTFAKDHETHSKDRSALVGQVCRVFFVAV